MIQRIELLAHAGAPSNRKGDERYRAQAEAYGSFNATSKVALTHAPNEVMGSGLAPRTNVTTRKSTRSRVPNRELYLDDTQLAYTALDSQLLTSSLRYSQPTSTPRQSHAGVSQRAPISSKRKRTSVTEDVALFNSSVEIEDRSRLKSSQILPTRESPIANASTTSSYLKSPEHNRSRKKAKVDIHRVRRSSEPLTQGWQPKVTVTPIAAPQTAQVTKPLNNNSERSEASSGSKQNTSELPTSYSLSNITSGSSRVRPNVSQRSASDPGPQIGSISPTALREVPTPRKAASQSPLMRPALDAVRESSAKKGVRNEGRLNVNSTGDVLQKHPHLHPHLHPHPPQSATPKSSVALASTTIQAAHSVVEKPHRKQKRSTLTEDLAALQGLSSSIRAPQPAPATDDFETHATDHLRYLVDNLDMNKAYSPVSVSRDLRTLERGHWLLKCPAHSEAWPLGDQIAFWRYLEKTIGKGNAGWGVWCARNSSEMTSSTTSPTTSLGSLQVFCWGEIVQHVYLLLYVASRSKVKKLGMQWKDAEGQVIIQMRSS